MTTDERDDLPLLTLDLDGVICAPPFGVNLGISRRFFKPGERPHRAVVPPRWLSWPIDHLRFDLRRPLPGVAEALQRLSEVRRLAVLTGRRSSPVHWLRWHGLDAYLDDAYWNVTWLPSPHFKAGAVIVLEAAEHIDDDGRTAQLIVDRSEVRSFVRDWPRNRDLPYHERVERVADLGALADLLTAEEAARG
ncbi:MAG: hypothetical protein OXC56_03870 [Chloroflexi bacterium]|nr:hypothetical protein [Chloroflexota bacterium]